MRLGKFRLKRTILGLGSIVLILSVIRYYRDEGADDGGLSNDVRLDHPMDANLAANILAGEEAINNEQERTNMERTGQNITNSRKGRDYGEASEDSAAGEQVEHADHAKRTNDAAVNPSDHLYLSDIRARSNLLRQQCQKLRSTIEKVNVVRSPPDGLIIDEKFRLMYCVVPKAACSSWKEFFYEIGGYAGNQANRHKKRKQVLKYFDHLSFEERSKLYPKLYKFLFVRHPFIRLLSAFRDKMAPNGSYERLHTLSDNRAHYFWRNRLGLDIVSAYHGDEVANRMKSHKKEYELSFVDFVRYLVDHPEHPYTKDRHWTPMYKLCRPCDVHYEFIANFETIETDSVFIRRLVKAELPERNKHATNSSNVELALSYYKEIPKDLMAKLYERYRLDFELFGYNPEPFL